METKKILNSSIAYFKEKYPVPETELVYVNLYQITVAVILSAQCTDKRVNIITPDLFKRFGNFGELAKASQEEVFGYIKSCTYPNNKSKNLIAMAQTVTEKFNGNMPPDVELLQTIPGIGRKSANVIAAVGFGQNTMAVDTHVFRVSQRIGLITKSKNPLEVEKKLVKLIPHDMLTNFHHWLILHGRYVCQARKPKCGECGLREVCQFYNKLT
jgi:endonuclease III